MHLTIVEPDPMDRDDDGRSLSDQGSHSVDQISSNQQEMENTSLFVSFNTNFKLTSLKIKQLKVGVFFVWFPTRCLAPTLEVPHWVGYDSEPFTFPDAEDDDRFDD